MVFLVIVFVWIAKINQLTFLHVMLFLDKHELDFAYSHVHSSALDLENTTTNWNKHHNNNNHIVSTHAHTLAHSKTTQKIAQICVCDD